MNQTLEKIPVFASRHLFLLVLLFSAFNQFSLITADPDLWGHIKFGEDAWRQGALPTSDPYSYTAQDATWINHEWLTEILFFKLYDFFGSTGILIFKMTIGLSIIALLARNVFEKGQGNLGPFLVLSLLIPILAPGFMPRPHLFSYFFWTLLILALQYYFNAQEEAGRGAINSKFTNQKTLLISIPLLFILWINTHGGTLAGLAILGTAALYDVIRTRNIRSPLLLCALASAIATLLNPYGYELWAFFMHSLSLPRNITEWNGIPLWHLHQWPFKLFTILFICAWLTTKNKWRWDTFIIFPSIYFAYKHQRHVPLAAIAMTPFLMEHAKMWVIHWSQNLYRSVRKPAMLCLLLFGLAQASVGYLKNSANQFQIFVDPGVYPVYAARFMSENKLSGNIWNPFDWGEYLIWKLPENKISVDGRFRTVYPEDLLNDSIKFSSGGKGWESLLEKYPSDFVLARKAYQTHLRMNKQKGWTPIYEDLISVLYVKSSDPENPIWKQLNKRKLKQNPQTPSYYFP